MKKVNINHTIYDLAQEFPEFTNIMISLGFEHIANPLMLKTAGKMMTLKTGAKMKNIDMDIIRIKFAEYGFELEESNE